ncbi:hypothetical protein [Cryptosporangium sp. NPDC051539]|uniref:hypothetical protein n=1 Tax=Cryptosporangium sp. NPDC051539 TaxID=3363962 RepID=UPI00379DA6CA
MAEETRYWWNLKHSRVETDDDKGKASDRLGPYTSREAAEKALETVANRNAVADAEDRRWND